MKIGQGKFLKILKISKDKGKNIGIKMMRIRFLEIFFLKKIAARN